MFDLISSLDLAVVRWFASWRAPWLDPVMVGVSAAGLYGTLFVVIGAGITATRRGWTVMALWRLVLAVILAQVVTTVVLKPMFPRERPWEAAVGVTAVTASPSRDSSMPSGHTATAIAGAITVSLLWPEGRVVAWVLALLIMASRVYLGMHYPTDLAAGAFVGWICAMIATVRMPAVYRRRGSVLDSAVAAAPHVPR